MPEPSTIVAALLIAVVPSVLYLLVLNAIDRYEKEPWTILLACLGLGALAAPILVMLVLVLLGRPAALPPAFAPGLRPDPCGIVERS
jgi:RsiW-degrading membrane proteinase PrsW (M82 family)